MKNLFGPYEKFMAPVVLATGDWYNRKTDIKRKEVPMAVPNIDYSLCQGCGGCAEAFPEFFEMRDDKAWVINAERFRAEDHPGVLTICPYYAISLV